MYWLIIETPLAGNCFSFILDIIRNKQKQKEGIVS